MKTLNGYWFELAHTSFSPQRKRWETRSNFYGPKPNMKLIEALAQVYLEKFKYTFPAGKPEVTIYYGIQSFGDGDKPQLIKRDLKPLYKYAVQKGE